MRPFITTRNFKTIYTAYSRDQLTPVLDKAWLQLNWLNMHTNGGMKRSRQKIDNILQKRASLLTPEGVEYGRYAEIEGIIADNPRKVRGDRCERLIFEEGGSYGDLIKAWIQGNALVELGGRKIGMRLVGGTGGDAGPMLDGLATIFNNPTSYNVLPYKNTYTKDGSVQFTGFFIPAHEFSLMPEYLDKRGVTDSVGFKEHYEKERSQLTGKDLVIYTSEHCFTPDEALLQQGDNLFDSVILSERITQIKLLGAGEKPKHMGLIWDRSGGDDDSRKSVKAIESARSKLLVVEPPILDSSGVPYKNLYVIGLDSIDMGKADSANDTDVSDLCAVVKRRVFGLKEPKYVAMYKDRPTDIKTAYEMVMKLAVWYNAQILLEYTKISIQMYFKTKNMGHLFMARPRFAMTDKTRRTKNKLVGMPSSEAYIKHGLELVDQFILDYGWTIDIEELLMQLLNYSYVKKRKFDCVAAMQMAEIADEDLSGVVPTKVNKAQDNWQDFGYYIDENGHKRLGAIPQQRSSLWN